MWLLSHRNSKTFYIISHHVCIFLLLAIPHGPWGSLPLTRDLMSIRSNLPEAMSSTTGPGTGSSLVILGLDKLKMTLFTQMHIQHLLGSQNQGI